MIKNPMTGTIIEFNILQSFPVSCLNRDDAGAPKTAVFGGVTRARVSSQCWKRQIRTLMHEMGMTLGIRTKLVSQVVADACIAVGATDEQAKACGDKVEQSFIKKKEPTSKKPGKAGKSVTDDVTANDSDEGSEQEKSDALLFLSPNELKILADAFLVAGFDPDQVITQTDQKKQAKQVAGIIKSANQVIDGVDIALFGRMIAQASELKVNGAISFSHALSTHRAVNDLDFFTASDDVNEEPGSAHMGSLEFNSATYYRYVCIDLGQLYQSLGEELGMRALDAFMKALFLAVPSARQNTQAAASPWSYARVLVKRGQGFDASVAFEAPIRAKDNGFLRPSIDRMTDILNRRDKKHGSLNGKIAEFIYDEGSDDDFNIDSLIEALKSHAKVEK